MAAGDIDYSKLRDQTLGSGQDEEAVTVNTRALIDKVLARYSGEHTTIRELIQNAADASATNVSIKFETLPSPNVPLPPSNNQSALLKHTVRHHTLRRLLVSNNGQPFGENDWSRLKRIAEGNPDETKIGAFGVGFYSVFSECENPFVISGDQSMAFYWKGNSLFTRRGRLPPDASKNTSFVLDYRSTNTAVPDLMSICQFLSTSLTFVALEGIELWLDDWKLFSLTKKYAPSEPVNLPKEVNPRTKEGLMHVTGVSGQNAQMDASWMNIVGWTPAPDKALGPSNEQDGKPPSLRTFFSRFAGHGQHSAAAKRAAREEEAAQQAISEDITGESHATVFVRVSTVNIRTRVSSTFAAELERATKKPPPKTTKIEILTSSHDETEASMSTVSGAASSKVANAVLGALPTKNGRIFIGFPTAQTTGLLAHISAPSIIPTVERENIDLNARHVRTWNQELLGVAGIACRIAYAVEMNRLQARLAASTKTKGGTLDDDELKKSLPAAIHILKQFAFKDSTPLPRVSSSIEEAFWTCTKKSSIEMISSCGVLPSDQVRIASESLSFVKGLPVVPEDVMKEASGFVQTLKEYGFLSDITNTDIKRELEKQALTEAQLEEFLKWAGKKTRCHELETDAILSLFESTIVNMAPDATGQSSGILELRSVRSFLNPSRIPPELPLPPVTIPLRFTKSMTRADLESFGWDELQIVPWLRWIMENTISGCMAADSNVTKSPAFAQQVLTTLSKGFDTLSQSSKTTVIELLVPHSVVPTRLGMRKPSDAYFPSVRLFDDLPTTKLDGVKEKFLKALGVRKTIELSVIFERLMNSSDVSMNKPSWSHIDLIKYLVSVWNDIPESDINQLRNTALCPAEVGGDSKRATNQRFKLSELYEPKDSLRELGLPVVQWPGIFNAFSSEGKFLRLLGLRTYPAAPDLIRIIADAHSNDDVQKYEAGLRYFVENHYQNNYAAVDLSDIAVPFLPIEGSEKRKVAAPKYCFTNVQASVLGYQILRSDLRSNATKFGVRENPPIFDCAQRLVKKPPKDEREAKSLFGYFATRLQDISPNLGDRLGSAAIIPIRSRIKESVSNSSTYRLATPNNCFLGDAEEYGDIFDYVDFGHEANLFLLKVGSKHEPSITELTRLLIREPARIFQSLKVEKYLNLLRKLHVNASTLKKDKALWKDMKKAPFLLAYQERLIDNATRSLSLNDRVEIDEADPEEQSYYKEWCLRSADKIIIVDDLISFMLFRDNLLAAPQEETIEELYSYLGTPNVGDLIQEEPRLGSVSRDQRGALHLKQLIFERARLFLHEQHPSNILHDAKWLEKNLTVQTVQSVSLRRTLKAYNQSHTERRSAACTQSMDGKTKYTLAITSDYDVWQVSQEVVSLLVSKQRAQNALVFEMFLTTSLYKLRSRGYDVDRVLKRKQQEARAAELEKQRKAEEEKKQRVEEEKAIVARSNQDRDKQANEEDSFTGPVVGPQSPKDNKALMPGAFDETPERTQQSSQQAQQPRGLFSSIKSGLGLEDNRSLSEGLDNFLRRGGSQRPIPATPQVQPPSLPEPSPPPYTPHDPRLLQAPTQGNAEHVTPPGNVNRNLKSAIAASRSNNSTEVFSRPETNQVKEVSSYCDSKPGANLKLIMQLGHGMQVYLDQSIGDDDAPSFVEQNVQGLNLFESVLLESAHVFNLRKDSIHIYYDTKGEAIAFNRSGAIFCNYRYFLQLHLPGMLNPDSFTPSEINAMVYWWVTICHELAHNIVQDHSSNHSYYTEHFVMEFFSAMANKAMKKLYDSTTGTMDGASEGTGRALTGVERAFS